MNNLKDIHNFQTYHISKSFIVLSGFQWTIWRIYTTPCVYFPTHGSLFYQDFNEQFEGYTQPFHYFFMFHRIVLSGFQWTIWRIYTTVPRGRLALWGLFYQDFNEQFEGYTQLRLCRTESKCYCFIRISMNNLKDIHNPFPLFQSDDKIVLSGFQWTILLQKYRKNRKYANLLEIILIFQKKALPLHQQIWRIYTIRIIPLCKHSEWHASVALFSPKSLHFAPIYSGTIQQATAPQMYHPNKIPISLKQFAMQQQSSSAVFPQ